MPIRGGNSAHGMPSVWWRGAVDLPGLRAQLRRRQRRRHRRPRRRAPPARLPARPRRRRDLVHPVVRVAARRRRLRRRRLPRHRPAFGTLAEAEPLITEALALGIRTIIDVVPNHVSDQHPWFHAALAGGPGLAERDRFWFHPGRGADGERAAERLGVALRRDAWTRTTNPDGTPGRVVPAPVRPRAARPELGPPRRAPRARGHPAVLVRPRRRRRAHRLGGAAGQGPGAARGAPTTRARRAPDRRPRRAARRLPRAGARSPTPTTPPRVLVGEMWLPDRERFARYLRPDEMHTAFNFDFLARPWDAAALREHRSTDARRPRAGRRAADLGALQPRRHPAGHPLRPRGHVVRVRRQAVRHADRPRARRRAAPAPPRCSPPRCPGSLYIYQGDELGLPEVEDLPLELLQDPMHFRSGRRRPGPRRMPRAAAVERRRRRRSASARARRRGEPWLPQPADWAALTVEAQAGRPGLDALAVPRGAAHPPARPRPRRRRPSTWLDRGEPTSSRSGAATTSSCVVEPRRPSPSRCPAHDGVLLASATLVDGRAAARRRGVAAHSTAPEPIDDRDRTSCSSTHRPCTAQRPTRRTTMKSHDRSPSLAIAARSRSRRAARRRCTRRRRTAERQDRASASRPPARHRAGGLRAFAAASRGSSRRPTPTSTSSRRRVRVGRPDLRRPARRRHPARRLPDPVHRRQEPDRERPARRHHRRGRGARRTPTSFNPNMLDVVQDADGKIYGVPTPAYAIGLHYNRDAVRGGRARPRQPADDVGRGARGRQDDRRRDRQGRLRADDPEQHRRLDAHRR